VSAILRACISISSTDAAMTDNRVASAVRARDPFFARISTMRTRTVGVRWLKIAINRDATIKNETLAFKAPLRIFLKVF
jgi:hypothetical protein